MILLALALLASPPPSQARGRIAITISGGVSLGSYEAGLTWTFIRYLRASDRATDLAAVTGASAGAVNALMAAAMYCEERTETRDEDPDTNLFHELWAPVGLEDLLPDDRSKFTPADALLTAAPLERAFERLRAEIFGPHRVRFRPGCAVSVGLTVTRDRPEERTVAGLRARTQRFVIPWRFEVDPGGQPRIVSAPLSSNRDVGDAQLILAEPGGVPGIGPLQATQAALASGAFPFAFRPRQLCDCSLRCPEEEVVRDGVCEGPDLGNRITSLSCEAIPPAGMSVGSERRRAPSRTSPSSRPRRRPSRKKWLVSLARRAPSQQCRTTGCCARHGGKRSDRSSCAASASSAAPSSSPALSCLSSSPIAPNRSEPGRRERENVPPGRRPRRLPGSPPLSPR